MMLHPPPISPQNTEWQAIARAGWHVRQDTVPPRVPGTSAQESRAAGWRWSYRADVTNSVIQGVASAWRQCNRFSQEVAGHARLGHAYINRPSVVPASLPAEASQSGLCSSTDHRSPSTKKWGQKQMVPKCPGSLPLIQARTGEQRWFPIQLQGLSCGPPIQQQRGRPHSTHPCQWVCTGAAKSAQRTLCVRGTHVHTANLTCATLCDLRVAKLFD